MPCPHGLIATKIEQPDAMEVIRNKKSDLLFYIIFYQARFVYFAKLLVYLLWLIPPLLALFLRRRLLSSISCTLSDVLLVSNGVLGTHDRKKKGLSGFLGHEDLRA